MFQKQVSRDTMKALPGEFPSANSYYVVAAIAGEDLPIGVFAGLKVEENPNNIPTNPERVYAGGDNALGVVLRVKIGVMDLKTEAYYGIRRDYPVELITRGDVVVNIDPAEVAAAKPGMKVFYRKAESAAGAGDAGTVKLGEAGGTVADHVESKFYFVRVLDETTGALFVSTERMG